MHPEHGFTADARPPILNDASGYRVSSPFASLFLGDASHIRVCVPMVGDLTPRGSRPVAQGCPHRGKPWVSTDYARFNPNGVAAGGGRNPVGVDGFADPRHPGSSAARPTLGYKARPLWGRRPDELPIHRRWGYRYKRAGTRRSRAWDGGKKRNACARQQFKKKSSAISLKD